MTPNLRRRLGKAVDENPLRIPAVWITIVVWVVILLDCIRARICGQ